MKWNRTSLKMLCLVVISLLVAGVVGCAKSEEAPGKNDAPEMQKQREDKKGGD